jgi:hypothetical protein
VRFAPLPSDGVFLALIPIPSDYQLNTASREGVRYANRWDKFKSSGSPLADDACAPSTRALLAKQIIEIAQKGERNIDRLVENGVAYLQEVK